MGGNEHLKVAAAQVESVLGDLDANVGRHLEAIDEARSRGVDLLLFPELSLTGHGAGADALDLARPRDDPLIARLARAAGPMTVCFGLIEEAPAAQFYNASVVVRDGEVCFLHRKVNLPSYGQLEEGKHYASGRYIETFTLGGRWRASVLVCADLWNPALVWLAALHGATLLLAPISSALEAVGAEFDNPGGWSLNLRFYAMTYGFPVVMANRVGREEGHTFWGGSRVLGPYGETLAHAGEEEALLVATLDYERIRSARYLLPTVRDSNFALVLREMRRLSGELGVPDLVRNV